MTISHLCCRLSARRCYVRQIDLRKVACALVMAGEDLEKHTAVKDILIQIDVYFQVQLPYHSRSSFRDEAAEAGTTTATERTGTRTETTSLETTTSMDDSST
ncbi:hypothetical protein Csa_018386 [Cucumis sativus]|nr:hypothetical protein Csa_018386 [Cucumis sativus]